MKKPLMFLSLMISLIGTLVFTTASFALLTEHLNYDGCDSCHNLHGSGSGYSLLAGVDTEATCLACHGSLTPVATEVAVHDPAGVGVDNQGYITCRECHSAHSNEGNNDKLVGYDWDPEVDPSKDSVFANPTIRVELTTSDINSPVYKNVTFETRPDDFKRQDGSGICQACHNAGPTSGPTVLQDHEWGDCVICHMHEDGFKKRQCVECHDVNASLVADAPRVLDKSQGSPGQIGSHLRVNGGDPIVGLTDLLWTVQCIECHTGHSGDVIVPNYNAVGIDYQKTGGIGLGGAATLASATSEADICWDCHGSGQSEWNASPYDLNVADWTDPTAQFSTDTATLIPNRPVRSIHSANPHYNTATGNVNSVAEYLGGDTQSIESADAIRCSYCHDVHSVGLNGFTPTGKPYLRGTWRSNPYKFDSPPESGDTYAGNSLDTWMNFTPPRLFSDSDGSMATNGETGHGYFIDQNSAWPTYVSGSYQTASETAGLCLLCHGKGATDTEKVDDMDWYPTSLWAGTGNGHANSALSGTGVISNNASDIFDGTRGDVCIPVYMGAQGSYWLKKQSAPAGDTGKFDYGVESFDPTQWNIEDGWYSCGGPEAKLDAPFDGDNTGQPANEDWGSGAQAGIPAKNSGWYGGTPGDGTSVEDGVANIPLPSQYGTWYNFDGSTTGIGTAGSNNSPRAHNFTCSKCHNPHAAGLPALLETNCLDVDLATWGGNGPSDNASDTSYGPKATSVWGQRVASNCHRKDDTGSVTSDGWNTLSPGL